MPKPNHTFTTTLLTNVTYPWFTEMYNVNIFSGDWFTQLQGVCIFRETRLVCFWVNERTGEMDYKDIFQINGVSEFWAVLTIGSP